MTEHNCPACKGSGKVKAHTTRVINGEKRIKIVVVDCPIKLAELLDTGKMKIEERGK